MTRKEYILQQHPEEATDLTNSGMKGCCANYGLTDVCPKGGCLECWEEVYDGGPEIAQIMWESASDPVNHPAYYTAGGIECIDAITAALSCQEDPVAAWLTGQVIKYLWRWPLKNGVEDLRKARFYLDRLISREDEK